MPQMPDEFLVTCPFCGEQVEIYVEPDVNGSCEVCCNPWRVPGVWSRQRSGCPCDTRRRIGMLHLSPTAIAWTVLRRGKQYVVSQARTDCRRRGVGSATSNARVKMDAGRHTRHHSRNRIQRTRYCTIDAVADS